MRLFLSIMLFVFGASLFAHEYCFRGKVMDSSGEIVPYANVALYPANDSIISEERRVGHECSVGFRSCGSPAL